MKHRVKGRKLSRIRKQRRALIKTLLGSLILREKIKTTEAKAKEIKPLIDRLISQARKYKNDEKNKVIAIRELKKRLPASAAIKLTGDFLNKFGSRTSGYTRINKLSARKSDGARMVVIEFI
jgi:large subunit ribosomal protein L17